MTFDVIKNLSEIGGGFKFGRGLLGKSAFPLGIVLIAAAIAIGRLKSDISIIVTLILSLIAFFMWFFPVLRFSEKHPDIALLEGAEWTGYKRFEASAKGYKPTRAEQVPTLEPGSTVTVSSSDVEEPDK